MKTNLLAKRIFLLPLMIAALLFALSSCGGGGGGGGSSSPTSTTDSTSDNDSMTESPDSTPAEDVSTASGDSSNGESIYTSQCAVCHGNSGEGGTGPSLVECSKCSSFEVLQSQIETTMPQGNASSCVDTCANDAAAYILEAFN